MTIEVYENTKIYILCPAYIKSGGPEHMHQTVSTMKKLGYDADIVYYDLNKPIPEHLKTKRHPEYDKYLDTYLEIEDIKDNESNIIVIPETTPHFIESLRGIRIIFWFLGVNLFISAANGYFKSRNYKIPNDFKADRLLLGVIKDMVDLFLCHSYHTVNYLKTGGITNYAYLSDYINKDFLDHAGFDTEKQDFVAINPGKGLEFSKKISAAAPDIPFAAIYNMTNPQVKQLLLKAKVYIDFGDHSGKDHLPREAAACNCIVITGKQGAASVYEDIPLPDGYKFDDTEDAISAIIDKIRFSFENYEEEIKKFEHYREVIRNEEQNFINDIKKIFIKTF